MILLGIHFFQVSIWWIPAYPTRFNPRAAFPLKPCLPTSSPQKVTSSESLFDVLEDPKSICSIMFKFCVFHQDFDWAKNPLRARRGSYSFLQPKCLSKSLILKRLWMNEGGSEWTNYGEITVYGTIQTSQWGKAFYSCGGVERQEIQPFSLAIKCFTSDPFWSVKS